MGIAITARLSAAFITLCFLYAPAAMARETRNVERADGSQIIYHVDLQSHRKRQPAILLLQGSGCDPVVDNGRINSAGLLLAPGHALIAIEKYGVGSMVDAAALVEGCSREFWQGNTLQQRVFDAAQVIARIRRARWWSGELVIFGGSEGGAVAAMLAPVIPETRAVIIFSSGIGVPVGDLVRAAMPPAMAAQAPAIFAAAKANPTGEKRWAGASYRWWADAVDVTAAKMLLQTTAPVLLIHGTRDQSAPVATARATRDLVAAGGKRNLTYREYERFDHFMKDAAGVDHRERVLRDAGTWLRKRR